MNSEGEGAGTFSTHDRPGLFRFKAPFPSTSSQCTLGENLFSVITEVGTADLLRKVKHFSIIHSHTHAQKNC